MEMVIIDPNRIEAESILDSMVKRADADREKERETAKYLLEQGNISKEQYDAWMHNLAFSDAH